MNKFRIFALVCIAVMLWPFSVFAQDTAPTISAALTSGAAGPTIGAALILVSWLIAKVKSGTPLKDQALHAVRVLFAAAPYGLTAAGGLLVAGQRWPFALGTGLTAMLVLCGFSAPTPPAPKQSVTAASLLAFALLACAGCGLFTPADSPKVVSCLEQYASCVEAFPPGPEHRAEFDACAAKVRAACLPASSTAVASASASAVPPSPAPVASSAPVAGTGGGK